MMRRLKRIAAHESGIISLEAAVTLPFVLLIGAGTVEFGWAMTQIHTVQSALRDATRFVSRIPVAASPGAPICNAQIPGWSSFKLSESDQTFESNMLSSVTLNICINAIQNADVTLNRGLQPYRVEGSARFTPESVGIMALFRISLPEISLSYELRHAGS
jgi:hypothetical protein